MEKLHGDFSTLFKIGREEISAKHGCGVRQGDNFAPTMLIIVMPLVAQDILKHLKMGKSRIPATEFSSVSAGVLKFYTKKYLISMACVRISMLARADDGHVPFDT